MTGTIHIVEPTLATETGHCFSFVKSLCEANKNEELCLWVNHSADILFKAKEVRIERNFYRRIRRLQCFFLYRKLLRSNDKILIATASTGDLALLNWAAQGVVQRNKAYLYFHWLNMSDKKFAYLKKLAKQQPNVVILGPTSSVVNVFKEAGFNNVHIVPYPVSLKDQNRKPEARSFQALLYAGAARQDKGISHVVDFLDYLNQAGQKIPFKLQSSANHHGEYDVATQADMRRLEEINYPCLNVFSETLSTEEYASLFIGAICIQLYNPTLFADRISGVTLDALTAGSPIVTTAGSWIANMVQRFDAGVVVDSTEPQAVLSAVEKIITNYEHYQKNAHAAGETLQQENSAEFLFKALVAR